MTKTWIDDLALAVVDDLVIAVVDDIAATLASAADDVSVSVNVSLLYLLWFLCLTVYYTCMIVTKARL